MKSGEVGNMRFVERHNLWSDVQVAAAREAEKTIGERGIELVRFAFADQHGLVRSKSIIAGEAANAMVAGVKMVSSILLKDTSNRTAWPVFSKGGGFETRDFEGAADVVLIADPTTFRILPWAENTGWVLCDAYFPDGRAVPFDTRGILRRALASLAKQGFDYVSGLEVEFYVFRLESQRTTLAESGWPGEPPQVSLFNTGYQLLSEQRFDQLEPALAILRREVLAMGMPLRSVRVEFGPSQCEFVFDVGIGIDSADTMILFRNAAKQIMRRHGLHASFMCRPRIPNVMSSGWHLHQSLRARTSGANAFTCASAAGNADSAGNYLSPTGCRFLAGLLANAQGATVFATPTVNGYRRYRPNSLAPDRATWGVDNRAAMLRVTGGAGETDAHIENRIGEPAANPYLYMASQIFAGLDGLARELDPGPRADSPYETTAPLLPTTLADAIKALRDNACMRDGFGSEFVDYYVRIKEAELARFKAEVTEWEHREYFDLF